MATQSLPRQVRLLNCSIYSPASEKGGVDLMTFVQRIDIYESLFTNTISGSITLVDEVGLVEYLPIVGVEFLLISFEVNDERNVPRQFTRVFRVTKITDMQYPQHNWRHYSLQFVTQEFITSISTRIARAFNDVTCQEAVKSILTNDLKFKGKMFTDEPTFGKLNVVIPKYTPLQAINYFTILAQTADTKESNFLFFETLEGFHFTSIAKLIKDGAKLADRDLRLFKVDPAVSSSKTVTDDTARNAIAAIEQQQSFDLLSDITSGTLRSKMMHFDFLARKVEVKDDSRYSTSFAETTHLDKHPVYPKDFDFSVGQDVRQFMVPSNVWIAQSNYVKSKSEVMPEQRLRESVMKRNRQMHEIKHMQTTIDLPGQPDLRAGSVVMVHYPSSSVLEQHRGASINKPTYTKGTPYYSGRHLVTNVHHILSMHTENSMEYRMMIQVCRDSLGAPLIGFE
jgi:hypothetical protein